MKPTRVYQCYCKCGLCGELFDEDELEHDYEYVGECWGQPAYEEISRCPYCGSDDIFDVEYREDEDGDEGYWEEVL